MQTEVAEMHILCILHINFQSTEFRNHVQNRLIYYSIKIFLLTFIINGCGSVMMSGFTVTLKSLQICIAPIGFTTDTNGDAHSIGIVAESTGSNTSFVNNRLISCSTAF